MSRVSRIEETSEGLRFDIEESKPWGESDEFRCVLVHPDSIASLPLSEIPVERDTRGFDEIWVWYIKGHWVGFHLSADAERALGPMDETFFGPFRYELAPPTSAELHGVEGRKSRHPYPFQIVRARRTI